MIGNEFRRIALARGLLPFPATLIPAEEEVPETVTRPEPPCQPDKPAIAEPRDLNA